MSTYPDYQYGRQKETRWIVLTVIGLALFLTGLLGFDCDTYLPTRISRAGQWSSGSVVGHAGPYHSETAPCYLHRMPNYMNPGLYMAVCLAAACSTPDPMDCLGCDVPEAICWTLELQEEFDPMSVNVAHIPIRLKDSQGASDSADVRQAGLQKVENARLDLHDVIEKRPGALIVPQTRSDSVDDLDSELISTAWTHDDIQIVGDRQSIFARNTVAGIGEWRRLGLWLPMQANLDYSPVAVTPVSDSDHALIGDVGGAVVGFTEDNGAEMLVLNQVTEARVVLDPLGSRTRVVPEGDDAVRIAYLDAASTLQAGLFSVEDDPNAIAFTPSGVATDKVWDLTSAVTNTGVIISALVNKIPSVGADGAGELRIFGDITLLASPIPLTFLGLDQVNDIAVTILPFTIDLPIDKFSLAIVATGKSAGTDASSLMFVNIAEDGTFALGAEPIFGTSPAGIRRAIGASWSDTNRLTVAVEREDAKFGRTVDYTQFLNEIPSSLGSSDGTALLTSGGIVSGLPIRPNGLLVEGFVLQQLGNDTISRSGWIMYSPSQDAYLARGFLGQAGNLTNRLARTPKGSLNVRGDQISWGGPVRTATFTTDDTTAAGVCVLTSPLGPHDPAYLDGVSLAAHGGYPRMYDGANLHEHDFHSMPDWISAAKVAAGTGLAAGFIGVAITWEHTDQHGQLYRSAPIVPPVGLTDGGGGSIVNQTNGIVIDADDLVTITIAPLHETERENVRMVLWRTPVNGSVYYRVIDDDANATQIFTLTTFTDEELIQQPTLDQSPGAGQVLPNFPTSSSAFVGTAESRFFTRDAATPSRVRFTTQPEPGIAPGWNDEMIIDEPLGRAVTAVVYQAGRIFFGSEAGWSEVRSDGPDRQGNPRFAPPLAIACQAGPLSQETCAIVTGAEVSPGTFYGSFDGPRLLGLGGQVQDISQTMDRQYRVDRQLVHTVVYEAGANEVWFVEGPDGDQTWRLNLDTNRWGADTGRLMNDIGVQRNKRGIHWIRASDKAILEESTAVYRDGDDEYALAVRTPMIIPKPMTHQTFRPERVQLHGEYVGPHGLEVDVLINTQLNQQQLQMPEATVAANALRGQLYSYDARMMDNAVYSTTIDVREVPPVAATLATFIEITGIKPDCLWDGRLADPTGCSTLTAEGGATLGRGPDTVFRERDYEFTGVNTEAFVAGNTTSGDVPDVGDVAIFALFRLNAAPGAGIQSVAGKRILGGTNAGWVLRINAGALQVLADPVSGSSVVSALPTDPKVDQYIAAVWKLDRTLNQVSFASNIDDTVTSPTVGAFSLTNNVALRIGDALLDAIPPIDGVVSLLAFATGPQLATLDVKAAADALATPQPHRPGPRWDRLDIYFKPGTAAQSASLPTTQLLQKKV